LISGLAIFRSESGTANAARVKFLDGQIEADGLPVIARGRDPAACGRAVGDRRQRSTAPYAATKIALRAILAKAMARDVREHRTIVVHLVVSNAACS